jgi:hypothetical protein
VVSDKPGFLEELKRRHVWRVAIAYAIAGWLIVQVATQVFPFFNIPNWTVRLVVLLIVIGFPIVVAFAWVYELTPDGIRRTAPADSPDARQGTEHRQIGRKLNSVIISVLVLAVALLLGNQFLWHKGMRARTLATAPAPAGIVAGPAPGARPRRRCPRPPPPSPPNPWRCCRSPMRAASRTSSTFPMDCPTT